MSTRTFTCNLCEALCGLSVEVEGSRITSLRGDGEDVLSRGHVCPKAMGLREVYEDPDRVRTPLVRSGTKLLEASWDDAMETAASRLRAIRKEHGKDAVALYVGNPSVHSHRGAMAAQLLTAALGTKNRFDPNSQDSNPRLFACMQVYGDALAMAVPDVERTDYLLMLGANPAASNGSMMGLGNPKSRFAGIRERGGKIVLLDPRRTETAAWCTSHHFIRPGGDAAFLLAVLHVLFEEGRIARSDLARIAGGSDELHALCKEFSPERVGPAVRIEAATIREIARDLSSAKRAAVYSRVGVCQNEFGPVASWLVEVLNLVTGNFDREGGVMFPTAAADIAPLGRKLIGNHWGRWRSRVRGLPEFLGALPSAVMSEEMETEGPGQVRALVCIAGNPVSSTPNGPRLERAIEKLDFVLAIDFYVNETTRHADVMLPPKHVFETGNYDILLSRFAVRNTAKYSPPIVETTDQTRDDWSIASELALRLHTTNATVRRTAMRAARSFPERMIDVLLRTGRYRLSLAELERAEHGIDLGPLEAGTSKRIFTPDGRARLAPPPLVADVPRVAKWVDEHKNGDDKTVLIGRRHLRSNNSWLHNVRSLAKGPDRARLMIHPADAARFALVDGSRARITSRAGELSVLVSITDQVMPGVVSLPHGFGQKVTADTLHVAGALEGESANVLTDEMFVEPVIGTSILNGVPVSIRKE